jgi:hypothetical protein
MKMNGFVNLAMTIITNVTVMMMKTIALNVMEPAQLSRGAVVMTAREPENFGIKQAR